MNRALDSTEGQVDSMEDIDSTEDESSSDMTLIEQIVENMLNHQKDIDATLKIIRESKK